MGNRTVATANILPSVQVTTENAASHGSLRSAFLSTPGQYHLSCAGGCESRGQANAGGVCSETLGA